MINLILFGPPGSGKGTQAQYIIKEKKLVHISTGDIFRKNISLKTTLGQTASSYMDKGQLVPDSVTIKLLESEIDSGTNSISGQKGDTEFYTPLAVRAATSILSPFGWNEDVVAAGSKRQSSLEVWM